MQKDTIPVHWWKLALLGATVLLSIGVMAFVALSAGIADPPYAGDLRWQTVNINDWKRVTTDAFQYFSAPATLPNSAWTLEAQASGRWGLWLDDGAIRHHFSTDGIAYISISPENTPIWREFIHVRADQPNTFYLHHADGESIFRVNEEIAWQGPLSPVQAWGLYTPQDQPNPHITLRLYRP